MSGSIAEEFDRSFSEGSLQKDLSDISTQLNTIGNVFQTVCYDARTSVLPTLVGIMDALRRISIDVSHHTRSSPDVLRLKIELFDKLKDVLDDESRKKAALQLMRDAGFEL